MKQQKNTLWLGGNLLSSTYSTPQACTAKCLADSACVAVMYEKSSVTPRCRQFNSRGSDQPNQLNYDLYWKGLHCGGM